MTVRPCKWSKQCELNFKVCRSISSVLLLSVLFLWIVCLLYVLLLPGLYLRAYDSQCAQIYQIIKCTVIFKLNSVMINVGHRPPCSVKCQHWLLVQLVVLDPIHVHCIDKSSLNILQIIFCVPQEENKSGFHFWIALFLSVSIGLHEIGSSFIS